MPALFLLFSLLALGAATPLPAISNQTLAARWDPFIFWHMPATPLTDASADPKVPKTWHDHYGAVDKDSFTFIIENQMITMWVQVDAVKQKAGSFKLCQDGIPETVLGHADMKYANSYNLLLDKLYVHEGNQCNDPMHVTRAQAFDDVWVVWQKDFVNLAADPRCADVGAQQGFMQRARRCIIKKNTAKPGHPTHGKSVKEKAMGFAEGIPLKKGKPKGEGNPDGVPTSDGKAKPCVPPLCVPKDKPAPKAPKDPNAPKPYTNCVPPLCVPEDKPAPKAPTAPAKCVPPLCIPK